VKTDRINSAYLSIVFMAMVPVSPAGSQYDRGTDFAVSNSTDVQIHYYVDEFDALLSAGGTKTRRHQSPQFQVNRNRIHLIQGK